MKIDTRAKRWLEENSDEAVLLAAGVPETIAFRALSYDPKPRPDEVEMWMSNLDYVHRPTLSQVKEKPELGGLGLALYGDSGIGKTLMAVQLLLEIVRSGRLDGEDVYLGSIMGAFFDWQVLSEHFREDAGGEIDPTTWNRVEYPLEGDELCHRGSPRSGPFYGGGAVVLDDLSRERPTAFNQDRLHYYLRQRNSKSLLTIITTNLHPDLWTPFYGDVLGPYMNRTFIAAEVT